MSGMDREPIFTRAARRGELASDADPMLIMDALAGAVWVRVVLRQLPIEDGYAAKLTSVFLAGITL
ncbi:TetR-like C-terminal domain-containing protein [Actinomycetes bacterium KLBMP 9797]